MATVLVLDALQRKSLAITRWLGMGGHRILTADSMFWTISRYSRFAARSLVYPDPGRDPVAFINWLKQTIAQEQVDAVLQTDDVTTAVLSAHADELHPLTGLLLPPADSFAAMYDKGESVRWFAQAGIPHPKTHVIRELAEVGPAARELGVPFVIKARKSSGARGLTFVRNLADAESAYAEIHHEYPWPIMQAYVNPGPKYMACLICDQHGQQVAGYVERVLRQYPIQGGSSTIQESDDRPDLLAAMAPLFAVLPWAGPLHADIMVDGVSGQPYVLEVNPRYWQSLHVAHRAGINFARLHLALALGEAVAPESAAKVGVRGRALLPFDLLAYLADPNRANMEPPFFSRYGANTFDDLLSWSDPGPTCGFLGVVLANLFNRKLWQAAIRLERT